LCVGDDHDRISERAREQVAVRGDRQFAGAGNDGDLLDREAGRNGEPARRSPGAGRNEQGERRHGEDDTRQRRHAGCLPIGA
jgi:hypothetical protein